MKVENRIRNLTDTRTIKSWSDRSFALALDHLGQEVALLRVRLEPRGRGFVCRARAFTRTNGDVVAETTKGSPQEAISATADTLKTVLRRTHLSARSGQ